MTDRKLVQRIAMGVALAGSLSQSAFALTHIGGAELADAVTVNRYDTKTPARPALTEQTEALTRSGPFVLSHDGLYVASGPELRRYDSRDLSQPASATWTAGSPVLAVADGPERGLVLVLDAANLTLVRFSDVDRPVALWALAVDSSSIGADPGRILVRDGNRAFVADDSIPGLRVVSVDRSEAPTTIATYPSPDGAVRDMALWGKKLVMASDAGLVVVGISEGDQPTLTRLGAYPMSQVPSRVDANSKYAFVADGQRLSVVDVDPNSAGFLANAVDRWQGPAAIRTVRLDKSDRAYVLVDGAYEILDAATYGGR